MELKIGILYLGLHNQLIHKFGLNRVVSIKEVFCKLGKHYILPKNLRYIAIKEMEELKLIEKYGRNHIKILDCKLDLNKEEDVNKLYKLAGLY